MNIYYWLTVPALLIIITTAVVRGSNMPRSLAGTRWHMRRLGLLLVSAGGVMLLAAPFTESHWNLSRVDVVHFVTAWGWAITWMTTPGMPPWYRYVMGMHRHDKPLSLRNELRALWDSFNAKHDDQSYTNKEY